MIFRYAGTSNLSRACQMFFHLDELKAFLTSRVTSRQYFLLPPFHRFPEIASFPLLTTWLMSSIVDLPFLKAYWLSARRCPVAASIRLKIKRSSVFPDESSMHNDDRMTVPLVVCNPWVRVQVSKCKNIHFGVNFIF